MQVMVVIIRVSESKHARSRARRNIMPLGNLGQKIDFLNLSSRRLTRKGNAVVLTRKGNETKHSRTFADREKSSLQ